MLQKLHYFYCRLKLTNFASDEQGERDLLLREFSRDEEVAFCDRFGDWEVNFSPNLSNQFDMYDTGSSRECIFC